MEVGTGIKIFILGGRYRTEKTPRISASPARQTRSFKERGQTQTARRLLHHLVDFQVFGEAEIC